MWRIAMKYIFVASLSLYCISSVAATMCLRNQFQCLNGDCISLQRRCDGSAHCSDLSDESNCDEYQCSNDYVRCGDRAQCTPIHFICDGTPDCGGSWDEKNCTPDPVCLKNEFQCSSGECILKIWRCDGQVECLDSSDESDCDTNQCQEGWIHCDAGRCVPPPYICDGSQYCRDGSDENNCDKCENWGCSHFCNETLLLPQCHCEEGYELDAIDKRTCKDTDECLKEEICDQKCLNTVGSFSCTCYEGYKLINKTCRIMDYESSEFIFFNEGPSVYMRKLTKEGLESTHFFPLPVQMTRITALNFDVNSRNLFIADADKPSIIAVNVSSLLVRKLVTDRISSPVDIAFDWLSNNLYWLDSDYRTVGVVSVYTLKSTVLIEDLPNPISLAISPYSGMMFVATRGFESRISMYGMNGKFKRILHSAHGSPLSLALHPSKDVLYWSDPSLGMISYVNYSSHSSPRILKMGISGIMSLTVSESDVLYTTENTEVNERVHQLKLAGYDKDEKWKSITSSFGKKYSGKSECLIDNGGCDYLCLTSELGRSCACSSGKTLDEDSRSCLSLEEKETF